MKPARVTVALEGHARPMAANEGHVPYAGGSRGNSCSPGRGVKVNFPGCYGVAGPPKKSRWR